MQPSLLKRRRKRERKRDIHTDRSTWWSPQVRERKKQFLRANELCNVYQDIDAAFTLDQEKKKRDRERER
jgi:hypothetical protein